MNRLTTSYFFISLFLGSLIYGMQQFTSVELPSLANNYLNDFLFMPIVLFVCLFTIILIKNNKNYQLPLYIILYTCALVSIAFEYYFPKVLTRYTADIMDVCLYFVSGLLFYFLQNPSLKRIDSSSIN
ncbi:MAG: hypothetical protein CMB99_05070 [Flavobacteriaceae bacterium]|nr:hypothetical protein [Flavobacteriaceae bacterium]